jgi:hypothetical protein
MSEDRHVQMPDAQVTSPDEAATLPPTRPQSFGAIARSGAAVAARGFALGAFSVLGKLAMEALLPLITG